MTIYYGDVRVNDNGITWVNGQPDMDAGLSTSVYLSLFLDLDWWGAPKEGSILHKYEDTTLTQDVANDIRDSCVDALAWLKEDGVAEDVVVTTEIQRADFLAIFVEIQEPGDSDATTYRYGLSWRETEEALNVHTNA